MVSRDAVLRDTYESGLPRAIAVVAAIWQLTVLFQVLAYLSDFRQHAVVVGVWLGLLAAAVWLVPRAWAGGLSAREGAAAVLIAIVAVALVGWERRAHGAPGSVDWSVVGSGWLLALVALSRPAWLWVSGALGVFAVHTVLLVRVLGASSLVLARLTATAYSLVVILVVFSALRPTAAGYAAIAGRRAALLSRARAEHAAAAAVQQDRHDRLALLEAEALPLLRAVADGSLDPADPAVLERCARHAAALRRALASRAPQAAGLLAELQPALSAAQARGLPLEIQVLGDPGQPGREVAEATLAAVDGVFRALPPHPVTLTVLASAEDVELYVAFALPPRATPEVSGLTGSVPAAAGWQAAVDVDETGAGCLEVRWRKQEAA
ncbi:MAG: hypothetical protein ACRDPO_33875 [Streptosporangiaceae bacterium]